MVSKAMFIEGIRTPFQLPHTGYKDMTGASLLSAAFRRLLSHVKIDNTDINHVVAGNVFHELNSPNIAEVSACNAGVHAPAHSISMACISGQAALAKGIDMINSDYADIVLVGGVEYLTDLPVRVSKNARKILIKARNTDLSNKDRMSLLSQLKPKDWLPDVLRVVEFQTNESFVKNGDKIAAKFGISREAQDDYGYRSHCLSNRATLEGKFPFVCSMTCPITGDTISTDSTLRKWTREKMFKMKSVRRGGTVTVATANQPCDGAATCLLVSESAANRFNLTPRARLSRTSFTACSPVTDLLMGTTHSIAKLKEDQGIDVENADVYELYEGFGGEVLSQLAAMRCPKYAKDILSLGNNIADIDPTKVNNWGGTIGLGHAFGATGIRLLLHAVGRLEDEGGQLGIVAGCAGGGLGAAFAVHRV